MGLLRDRALTARTFPARAGMLNLPCGCKFLPGRLALCPTAWRLAEAGETTLTLANAELTREISTRLDAHHREQGATLRELTEWTARNARRGFRVLRAP